MAELDMKARLQD